MASCPVNLADFKLTAADAQPCDECKKKAAAYQMEEKKERARSEKQRAMIRAGQLADLRELSRKNR